jgi:hypothetical protein
MEFLRLPRFRRVPDIDPMHLTKRDVEIIHLIHRHRFLRSSHIVALVGESPQQVSRRLQLLYHHGYLERPRCQIDYYHRGGSRYIIYGIGHKGTALLKREPSHSIHSLTWGEKNRATSRLFLEHALLVSDVMVALELACRKTGNYRLLLGKQLQIPNATALQREPFHWSVKLGNGYKVGLIPDRVFALEPIDQPDKLTYFFLEADRGTMPIARKGLSQSSFQRKLFAYEATWTQNLHRSRFCFHRFRVLTVTNSTDRVDNLIAACQQLQRGHGLFLFAEQKTLLEADDVLTFPFTTGQGNKSALLS